MARPRLPKSVDELAQWYMRYISPLSLVAGFIADNLFLTRRVDLLLTNALLFFYLVIGALGIALINLIHSGRLRHPFYLTILPLLPVVAQFAFGGLFSAFLSLYSRSAALPVSWIFISVLVIFMLGNERFAHFYARFPVQVSMYFTVLFSFLIFFLPVVFHAIGPWMFVLSGLTSLGVITLFLLLLKFLVPEIVKREKTRVARAIAVIFILFNALYFAGAIPPLPLALKGAGVYHSVIRGQGGNYTLSGEPLPWYESFLPYNSTLHVTPGESAYVYSAVFAPSGLSLIILHQWQRYDESLNTWVTTDTLRFSIQGGRDGGFRGYSIKTGITPGKWRVNVVTQYGQLIGRISFTVVQAQSAPALVQTSN